MPREKLRAVPVEGNAAGGTADSASSPNQLTVEQLAQETGLSVRNIRSHQARGLLPPPEVRVRVGYYGPEHITRLRLIQELQSEGLKLEGVKRLLDTSHDTGERILRVKQAADAPAETETGEVITAAELMTRFEIGKKDLAKVLARAQKLGVLVPLGGDHYEVPSPSLLDAAEGAVRLGIEFPHTLEMVDELTRHSQAVSRGYVKLFLEDVWKPFVEAGMPSAQWPDIADSMERTRPLAAQALLAVFRQTMSQEVEATFAEIAKRLSEGKR
jgi:DNA-binding transcriptional MerR regulator